MIILVDMDGVLADFEAGMLAKWQQLHPGEELFEAGTRSSFYITEKDDEVGSKKVAELMQQPGFFYDLPPMEGAIEALNRMRELHEVYIVTSAGIHYPLAASEKYQWIADHFDEKLLSKLIITPSKYMVRGAILIDDKPKIYKEASAEWEHVLFDASYNKLIENKRRLTWDNWDKVL